MANLAQNTVGWLIEQANKVQAAVVRERSRISMNNARIMALDAKVNTISDPAVRARLKARIASFVNTQAGIARDFRAFGQKFLTAYNAVKKWLADHGLLAKSGLSGLGIFGVDDAIVVPLALGAGLAAVALGVAYFAGANTGQEKALPAVEQAFKDYTAGKITEQKLHTIIANAAQYQKDSTPPKPPGLADSLTTPLLIIGGIAALVVFGPSIANAFGARTQRRAA